MKILQVGKYYHPERGGIETVTRDLAEEFSRQHESLVLVYGDKTENISINKVKVKRRKAMATIKGAPISLRYGMSMVREMYYADVVHLHFPNPQALLISVFFPFFYSKIVIHWHSDVVGKGVGGLLLRPFELILSRLAKVTVFTSESYRDNSYIKKYCAATDVVYLGIDERPEYFSIDSEVKEIHEIDEKFVLFVGRLVKYKGLEYLVRAMADVDSGVSLLIVGDGPEKEELSDLVGKLKLSERVRFLGKVSDAYLDYLFCNSIALVLPSIDRAEAFGVVQLEAMRAKLPVISTAINGSGVDEVNLNNVSGLVVSPKDSVSLAKAIEKLSSDAELRNSLSLKAYDRFINNFTKKVMTSGFYRVYAKFMKK